jgi:protein-disulfide isomerase-like protein with CxxC motif
MTDFKRTREALAVYDTSAAERQARWDRVNTTDHVEEAEHQDRLALEAVQEAFYQDTRNVNSREHCALADIAFMRRCVEGVR